MPLLDHFTAAELLAGAEAADVWPKNRAVCFGVTRSGCQFTQYTAALAKADFL
jgi:hypothetical protein